MDYVALYAHRFKNVNQGSRNNVWKEISKYIFEISKRPESVLDPACGLGEFINFCPAPERWASDMGMSGEKIHPDVRFAQGSFDELPLPDEYFDLIYLSNVLEHLESQLAVNRFLIHARSKLKSGGRVIIMGPNFKYCADEYFDCADHTIILTHVSAEEHLVAAGFTPELTIPKFLPYSFRSKLPSFGFTTNLYLRFKPAWRLLGKQFLLIGVK